MLVEKDKRSEKYALQLPYQEEDDLPFYIPKNVYLIGTMNTSDRSLAWLDYALRRRFAFVEIEPQFNEKFCQHLQKQGVTEGGVNMILEKINVLNQEIQRDINLGKNFMIGHSYFCQFDATIFDDENEWFKYVLQYEIEPLLREYWFDDESKVKRVLEN